MAIRQDWDTFVTIGLRQFLETLPGIEQQHIQDTPQRFVALLKDLTKGVNYSPEEDLKISFTEQVYDQMLVVKDIPFKSLCAHHLVPIIGVAHFGYIPDRHVIGLSKIPRVIDGYASRPQIQEKLTTQIVNAFQSIVKPMGCGLVMEATHYCMVLRGVEKDGITTTTSHLAGVFKTTKTTKDEFLQHIYAPRH